MATISNIGVLPMKINRWRGGCWKTEFDVIAEESFIRVFINGKIHCSLTSSPWNLDELVVGYLFSDGVISSLADIDSIEIEGDTVMVRMQESHMKTPAPKRAPPPCDLTPDTIVSLVKDMEGNSRLFQQTGCVHNAALVDKGKIITNCEDVGRHNAMDRLIGRCLIRSISFFGKVILFSGRIPEEILRKVVHLGCSAMISVSAPTSLAVDLAENEGIMLIGFVRDDHFNVYTHPEMLSLAQNGVI